MKKYSFTFITLLSVVLLLVSCTKPANKDDQDADNDPRNGSKWELVSDTYEVPVSYTHLDVYKRQQQY